MIKEIRAEDFLARTVVPVRDWPGILIHHAAISARRDKHYAQAIDDWHRLERKWEHGIGYHAFIEYDGVVAIGKRWQYQLDGAHCPGKNDWIGICLMGNYDLLAVKGSDQKKAISLTDRRSSLLCPPPTKRQIDSLQRIIRQFPTLPIRPHGRYRITACPGRRITANYWFKEIDRR